MKTLEAWEKSNLDLDDYLGNEPCEIDEVLFNYIAETVLPQFLYGGFVQGGECERSEFTNPFYLEEIFFYMTTSSVNEKYFYLGILPEFKQ